MFIIDSAYSSALSKYNTAAAYHPLFSKDRYNKAVCEALIGDYLNCSTDLHYLLQIGLTYGTIQENTAFNDFNKSRIGKRLSKEKITIAYNTRLRAVFDSLLNEDQSIRREIPYGDSIRKVDSSNIMKMNSIIEEYGWPTDELLGCLDFGLKVYSVLIIHQRNPDTRIFDYTPLLYNAYINGDMEVHEAAYFISLIERTDNFKINDAGIVTIVLDSLNMYNGKNLDSFKSQTGFIEFSDDRLRIINQKREEFGLESIDHFRRKLIYFTKDQRFKLSPIGVSSTYCFTYDEDYESILPKIKPIQ